MNDRQLRSFVAAAGDKSFSKAAEKAFVSTSALVQQINTLEKDVGFPLFKRSFHGLSLTDAGEIFYEAAQKILFLYDEALREGRRQYERKERALTICCPFDHIPEILLKKYQRFSFLHPGLSVTFTHASFEKQFDELNSGQADIALTAKPKQSYLGDLDYVHVQDDFYSFCMCVDHPLAGEERLTPEMIRRYRVISGRYPYLEVPFDERLAEYGISTTKIEEEYGLEVRVDISNSDDLLVIHSQWSQPYRSLLAVVPSDIPAGSIGFIKRKEASHVAELFIASVLQRTE